MQRIQVQYTHLTQIIFVEYFFLGCKQIEEQKTFSI